MSSGFDTNVEPGAIPFWSAVASTNGLNADPGCRCACAARLNWLTRKFWPPTIATTRPSRGSIATSAAVGPSGPVSHLPMARARGLLKIEVDARRHAVAVAEHLRGAVFVDQLLLDVVREVRRDGRVHRRRAHVLGLRQRRGGCGERVAARDLALGDEVREDEVAPAARLARVADGLVPRRVLRDRSEERRLRKRQLGRAVAEVGERRPAGRRTHRCRSRSCSGTQSGSGPCPTAARAARRGQPPSPCG